MTDAFVPVRQILAAAKDRPAGYVEELQAAGFVDGDYLRIPRQRYHDLCAKYGKKPIAPTGAGTELAKLLRQFGIRSSPGCSCRRHQLQMDVAGIQWCEANVDTIVTWLREEAAKRRLPFLDTAARLLVRRAIRNARRSAAN